MQFMRKVKRDGLYRGIRLRSCAILLKRTRSESYATNSVGGRGLRFLQFLAAAIQMHHSGIVTATVLGHFQFHAALLAAEAVSFLGRGCAGIFRGGVWACLAHLGSHARHDHFLQKLWLPSLGVRRRPMNAKRRQPHQNCSPNNMVQSARPASEEAAPFSLG